MKINILLPLALLLGLAHVAAHAAAQPTVQGCPYITAPADSLVVEGNYHLPSLVIWPQSVTQAYSGCVYIWFGTRLHSIARLNEAKVVDGVIEDLVNGVFDDSDLPPMVQCEAASQAGKSDCERFRKLWIEEFPEIIGEINKRAEHRLSYSCCPIQGACRHS
jgi:hypothetical protein